MKKRSIDTKDISPSDISPSIERRRFLTASALGAGALAIQGDALAKRFYGHAPQIDFPFTLGVASGDSTARSVVLWSRLAPDPLNGGGMPNEDVVVRWTVAKDLNMQRVVRRGFTIASPENGHAVHVNARGLHPNRWYYYQFSAGGHQSRIGRTRTLPHRHAEVEQLSFAFVSCQEYQFGYYTAYRHLANENIDFVVHLGDYLYEVGFSNPFLPGVRAHADEECVSLEQYRNRYAAYQLDEDLQAARASFPFFHIWDDHEIDNDWASDIPEDWDDQTIDEFSERRVNGTRAFFENLPLARAPVLNRHDKDLSVRLYRRFNWGKLARFNLLDCRQYRSDQPCTVEGPLGSEAPKVNPPCPEDCTERFDESLTILGDTQERWLKRNLKRSQARWNVVASSVWFSQFVYDKRDPQTGAVVTDADGNPIKLINTDCWDGYPVQRQRLLDFVADHQISNLVTISGDWHVNGAMDIVRDYNDPNSTVLGAEFACTSISSIGPWAPLMKADLQKSGNTHVKYIEGDDLRAGLDVHGYVLCHLHKDQWLTEFRVVDTIRSSADGQIGTDATFIVHNGIPGTNPI